jgi:hypothetical protein
MQTARLADWLNTAALVSNLAARLRADSFPTLHRLAGGFGDGGDCGVFRGF